MELTQRSAEERERGGRERGDWSSDLQWELYFSERQLKSDFLQSFFPPSGVPRVPMFKGSRLPAATSDQPHCSWSAAAKPPACPDSPTACQLHPSSSHSVPDHTPMGPPATKSPHCRKTQSLSITIIPSFVIFNTLAFSRQHVRSSWGRGFCCYFCFLFHLCFFPNCESLPLTSIWTKASLWPSRSHCTYLSLSVGDH